MKVRLLGSARADVMHLDRPLDDAIVWLKEVHGLSAESIANAALGDGTVVPSRFQRTCARPWRHPERLVAGGHE